jgi:protein-tyrosine phosphatase
MYDIHSHILPLVDDGAKSWDITLEMCRMAQADGIQHMVATPHANERYVYDREIHEASLAELRTRFGSGMEFSLGCDFHMSYENIEEAKLNPAKFSMGIAMLLSGHHFIRYAKTIPCAVDLSGVMSCDVHPNGPTIRLGYSTAYNLQTG